MNEEEAHVKPPTPGERMLSTRVEALRDTWEFARGRSDHWQHVLPDLPRSEIDLSTLHEIPPCTPHDLTQHRDAMRCQKGIPDFVVFTGGTTGAPRIIYGALPELDEKSASLPGPDPARPAQLGLTTGAGHHGYTPQVPGKLGHLQVPLGNLKNYQWAVELLTTEHDFEGYQSKITTLTLPLPAAKKLAHFMVEQDVDLDLLSLNMVRTFAWHLSARWRYFLESTFRCLVIDSFGFTEISTVAHECLVCGWYHYGPTVVWEVVDPHTAQPVNDGVGKLLVTTLYPATQDHLLFRYESGDVVQVGPHCDAVGDIGFKPLGRMPQIVWSKSAPGAEPILTPSDVQEAVDYWPLVARSEEARFSGVTSSSDDGFPKWRILRSDDPTSVELQIELKASPWLFRKAWDELERHVLDALANRNPYFQRSVDAGELKLTLRPLHPGALAPHDVWIT